MDVETFFKATPLPAPVRKGLRAMSDRRRREYPVRARVRAEVLARDLSCVAADLVPHVLCGIVSDDRPPLEVDEIVPRGRGGSWIDPENCQVLCQAHHDWVTAHPTQGLALGFRKHGA